MPSVHDDSALILTSMLVWTTAPALAQQSRSGPILEDMFGRMLNDRGITLVDWKDTSPIRQ